MFKPKTKKCQNCKADFTIEPEDFEFYEKIDVPAPTFCPECRLQRRFMFRNEGNGLYKRKNDISGEQMISIYNPKTPYKICDYKYWWSDKWDAMEYGKDYDFNKSFFEQFKELFIRVPQIGLYANNTTVNCNYCNSAIDAKNCYLVHQASYVENSAYSRRIISCKDCYDLYIVDKMELCYEDIYCYDSYKLFFSNHCHNCVESYFLYDCRNCQNCFACSNLRNKKYHIFNQPYTKKEYLKKLAEFDLGSYQNLIKYKDKYQEIYQKAIHKFAHITKSVNCIGDEIKSSKNCYGFDILKGTENCKFLDWGGYNSRDSYDVGPGFGINAELMYEVTDTGVNGARVYFAHVCWTVQNAQYCMHCHSSSDLFGCVGLRHKKYCILNKQYTKESFDKLRIKIIKHMNEMPYIDKKGRVYKYGEFFPSELSPFGYNETVANEYFPLTKEQSLKQGYNWYDRPKSEYKATIQAKDLPDNIKDINDSIINEIIECVNSKSEIRNPKQIQNHKSKIQNNTCQGSGVFRIIPAELKFYQKYNIPIPRLCPDCRHRERIKQRNPMKLWHRQCMKEGCSNEFETSYAPDRKEIVYCESCYNKEIG